MRFVAGRGAVAERLVRGAIVAERHREDVACCGTADAEPAGKGTAGTEDCWPGRCGGAVAGREPSAQRTADRDADEAAARQGRRHRARAPMRSQLAGWPGRRQCESAAAEQWRWQKARAGAGRQILSDSPSDLAITSAAQVLPYVFTAVRGISQSC